ncbi:MAG: SulP family inorganic anion transporter [Gemmatimonadota bacterium]
MISVFGGSRVQIGGPTGAFVVIVYGIIQQYGIDGLTVATLMAGVILIVMGLAGFGSVISFIPHPLVTGFTSGIALLILSSQVKDFFGLKMGVVPADFVGKWDALLTHAGAMTPAAAGVGVLSLAIIIFWPSVSRRVPAPFVALIVSSVTVWLLHLPVETIGSRFGEISSAIPHPTVPVLTMAQIRGLVAPAFTIAMLAAIESLLSAVVADGMIGGRHRSNMELIAQGLANVASPLFGGIPATGAIARTATNVKSGGRTPVAGIIHALTLLVITLFASKWAAYIPLATLAAILVVVAYHMSDWRGFRSELTSPKSDVVVLLTTFALTVFVDLTVAISVGMVLAAFLFIRRMVEVTSVNVVTDQLEDAVFDTRRVPKGVEVFEITGPLFFGAATAFRDTLGSVAGTPRVLIVRMRDVPALDSTGLRALAELVRRTSSDRASTYLTELRPQPLEVLRGSEIVVGGHAQLFDTLDSALDAARRAVETHLPRDGSQPIGRPPQWSSS